MSFKIGQEIVCICGDWTGGMDRRDVDWVALQHHFPNLPQKGKHYHVRGYDETVQDNQTFIFLEEVMNPVRPGWTEGSFCADCFRPLIERKTDITVFTKLLTPTPTKVKESV